MEHGSNEGDAREARLQPTAGAARIIRPELLPNGYVHLLSTPRVVWHGEAGSLGHFQSPALWQAFAPCALVSALSEEDLCNAHRDEIIVVYVIPLSAIPTSMVEALEQQPIAGPIPDAVPDAKIHHRSLKQLREDLVVAVAGCFSKEEILTFVEHVEVDAASVNLLLGREKRSDSTECVEFGCAYCRDDQNRLYGHVTQIGSDEVRQTILLRCRRCGALYENSARGPDETRRLTEAEAEDLFPGSIAT